MIYFHKFELVQIHKDESSREIEISLEPIDDDAESNINNDDDLVTGGFDITVTNKELLNKLRVGEIYRIGIEIKHE